MNGSSFVKNWLIILNDGKKDFTFSAYFNI